MAVNVEAYERLFRRLEETIGYENTVTLMELLSSDHPDRAANAEVIAIDLRESGARARPRRQAASGA